MKSLSIIFICSCLLFTGCIFTGERVNGNGNVTTENRSVKSAQKVKVTGGVDVVLSQGATSVRVEADENILPYITTEMEDGWLHISNKDNIDIDTENPMRVYISNPAFSHITVTGSSNVSSDEKISADDLMEFEITGSGNITTQIASREVKGGITGSGNLTLSGETKELQVRVTGSGNFKGMNLTADNARVNILGSGDAMVYVNSRLDAEILGSGDVKYKGNASVNKSISGSGSVDKVQ